MRVEFLTDITAEFGEEAVWSVMAYTWTPEDNLGGIRVFRLLDSLRAANRTLYHIHPSLILALNRYK